MSAGWKSLARQLLRRALRLGLFVRSRRLTVTPGTRLVIVSPHPDDDVLGCSGLILQSRAQGATVHVIYITDGSASHPGHPLLSPPELALRRTAEARAATSELGLSNEHLWALGAADGTLRRLAGTEAEMLIGKIAAALGRLKPDLIAVPCRRDGSSEHDAVFGFVQCALAHTRNAPRVIEYPIWAWWNPLRLRQPAFASHRVWRIDLGALSLTKRKALAHHRTQIEATAPWNEPVLSPEFVTAFSSGTEYFFET